MIEGVDCEKGVDDCLIQATSEDELLPKLRALLEAARSGNMKFSRKKIQIRSEVDFCGYRLTKVASIMSSMKTFLGMTNQFSTWSPIHWKGSRSSTMTAAI